MNTMNTMDAKITMTSKNNKSNQKYKEITPVPCNIIQVEFFYQPIWSKTPVKYIGIFSSSVTDPQPFIDSFLVNGVNMFKEGMILDEDTFENVLNPLFTSISKTNQEIMAHNKKMTTEEASKMFNYTVEMVIPKAKAEEIHTLLSTRNTMKPDEIKTYSVTFKDGIRMDVEIQGCVGEPPFTIALLFKNNKEVYCSEICSDFFGTWKAVYAGKRYKLTILEGK